MFHQLSPHIGYLAPDSRSDRPALGYIRGNRLAFAVDAGSSRRHIELFYSSLQSNHLPLPDITGISHSHWDHSYGAAFIHGVTLASDRCNAILRQEADWAWSLDAMQTRLQSGQDILFGYHNKLSEYPDPSEIQVVPADISLTGPATIDLGGITVEILYCGGPHCDDHLIFYVPEEHFLFLGDASGKELFTLNWEYDAAHPERLQDCLSRLPFNQAKLRPFVALLERLDFDRCLFAHADQPWTREALLSDLNAHLD